MDEAPEGVRALFTWLAVLHSPPRSRWRSPVFEHCANCGRAMGRSRARWVAGWRAACSHACAVAVAEQVGMKVPAA